MPELEVWSGFYILLINLKKEQENGKQDFKQKKVADWKLEIRNEFKETLDLLIDIPIGGAGTTNDRDNARRCLKMYL